MAAQNAHIHVQIPLAYRPKLKVEHMIAYILDGTINYTRV